MVLIAATALFFAFGPVAVKDKKIAMQTAVNELCSMADPAGRHSAAALFFQDRQAADRSSRITRAKYGPRTTGTAAQPFPLSRPVGRIKEMNT